MSFKEGTRIGLTFDTVRGQVSIYDLWNIPLQSKHGFDLDTIAQDYYQQVKEDKSTKSFVAKKNIRDRRLVLALDIIKEVIAYKLDEIETSEQAETKKAEKAELLDLLAEREKDELRGLSKDELRERIKNL